MTNRLLWVTSGGGSEDGIERPASIAGHATSAGLEGVTVTGSGDDETVWLAVQREWKDDPKGLTKLLSYRPADQSWGVVHYPLEAAETGWVGLSEITAIGDDRFVITERDNQIGSAARPTTLTAVSRPGSSTPPPVPPTIPVG